jgi:hypothetical protein
MHLPKFVNTINGVRQLGYNPNTIVSKFCDFERLQLLRTAVISSCAAASKRISERSSNNTAIDIDLSNHGLLQL